QSQRATIFPYTTLFRSENAMNRNIVNVRVLQGIHLSTLKIAHAAHWREHEYRYAMLAAQSIFRRRAGIARCRAQDSDAGTALGQDRKSTRLNSSHVKIS